MTAAALWLVAAAAATPGAVTDRAGARPTREVPTARRIPAVATVCIDPRGRGCWAVEGESQCQDGTAEVRVFRIVLPKDRASAVADCERALTAPAP